MNLISYTAAEFVAIFWYSSILRKIYQIDEARDSEIRKYVSENKGKNKNYKVEPELEESK